MCLLADLGLKPDEIKVKNASKSAKEGKPKNPKYSDKRREKSKIAARCRRGKESEIFQDLADSLPILNSIRDSLDKASIVRLALCDLKLRNFFQTGALATKAVSEQMQLDTDFHELAANALGSSFAIIISSNGDITYVSENISVCLGLTQCEVMGKSIYEYSHPCDENDVKELLSTGKSHSLDNKNALIRMKCTLTANGGCVHIRAATDKVIYFTGRICPGTGKAEKPCFIGIGCPIPHPSDSDLPTREQAFITKHSPDMKCVHVDPSIEKFVGYKSTNLIGKSLFEFQHAADSINIGSVFKQLYAKGQIQTEKYRFLVKNGGWVWMMTQATAVRTKNESKVSSIICCNYLLSEIQNVNEIVSEMQLKDFSDEENAIEFMPVYVEPKTPLPMILNEVAGVTTPVAKTSKIFAPRTEDMDSGFLMPDSNQMFTVVENPEEVDLTHLAPIAGDECVPLNSDLFEDLLKLFTSENPDSSLFEGSIIDLEELAALNSSEDCNISFIPIDGFNDICLPDTPLGSPLLQESDPVFGSTVDITPAESITPANLPININHGQANGNETQQHLHPEQDTYFDSNDGLELLMSLSDQLLSPNLSWDQNTAEHTTTQPEFGHSHSHFHPSYDRNKTQLPPPKEIKSLVESILMKRKATGDLPSVVTKSVFGFADSVRPNKIPRVANLAPLVPSTSREACNTGVPWHQFVIPGK